MTVRCRGPHPILRVEEFNALGAVVFCLRCKHTFQFPDSTLHETYYHLHHVSPEGPGEDADVFIHYQLWEN